MDIAIVSEIHPWQLIEQAVRDKYDPSVEAKLLHQFSTMAVHHAAVTDSLFWSSAYAEIASANGAGKYRQHEIQRLRELSVAKLEIARKILAEQYGILQFGNFSTLYNEDKNVDPIKALARCRSINVVWLDEGNSEYQSLLRAGQFPNPISYNAAQIQREKQWLPKIDRSGVMIVGQDHARNRWGLIDNMRAQGINPRIIYDCAEQSQQLASIDSEIVEIQLQEINRFAGIEEDPSSLQ